MLKDLKIPINNCRGQTYDNASNMAGKYSGVQARIKMLNPLAHFVPCSAHSLNLVGACAAECCVNAISLFGFVQTLYNFFAVSTHRWKLLRDSLRQGSVVPKSLSNTRWSARCDTTRAEGYREIRSVLHTISKDSGGDEPNALQSFFSGKTDKEFRVCRRYYYGTKFGAKLTQQLKLCRKELAIFVQSWGSTQV